MHLRTRGCFAFFAFAVRFLLFYGIPHVVQPRSKATDELYCTYCCDTGKVSIAASVVLTDTGWKVGGRRNDAARQQMTHIAHAVAALVELA